MSATHKPLSGSTRFRLLTLNEAGELSALHEATGSVRSDDGAIWAGGRGTRLGLRSWHRLLSERPKEPPGLRGVWGFERTNARA